MPRELGRTFDSIESAHDFVTLLSEAVADAKREIDNDVQREANGKTSRRLEALRLTSYSLEKLEAHMTKSRRILNDLRSLRRLLFQERPSANAAKGKGVSAVKIVEGAVSTAPKSPAIATSAVETLPGRPAPM